MKKFYALPSLMLACLLVACTYGNPVDEGLDTRIDTQNLPDNFSLLSLGRTISFGSVDIFDPWINNFNLPPLTPPPEHLLAEYPLHRTHIVRDSSVSLYDLSTYELGDVLSPSPLKLMDGLEIPDTPEVSIDDKQLPP